MPISDEATRPEDDRLYVASVAKAFAVLGAFEDERSALGLAEIAERSGIGRSAAQRFVHTLKVLGFLHQEPASRRYGVTARALRFANAYLRNDPLISMAFPYLREASRRTSETVNLTRLDGAEVIFVTRFPSSTIISADLVLGSRLPAYCSAPGRAMLAFAGHEQAERMLSESPRLKMTPHTITDLGALRARLEAIRSRGYEIAAEEIFPGDISIAAPVHGADGRVGAAVNIAVASPRWTVEEVREKLAPIITETARAISSRPNDLPVSMLG